MDTIDWLRTRISARAVARALVALLLVVCGCAGLLLSGCGGESTPDTQPAATQVTGGLSEDGTYTSKDELAAYIHLYGHLPDNFVTKAEARQAGWKPSEGNLDDVCPGKSIGGDRFYNDDGLLPDASGRTWTECDVGYAGGRRGAERIVFSSDGLIYYTADHYESFERLY